MAREQEILSALDNLSKDVETLSNEFGKLIRIHRGIVNDLAGKKQVPLEIFLIVVSALSLVLLINSIGSGGRLDIGTGNGISIRTGRSGEGKTEGDREG